MDRIFCTRLKAARAAAGLSQRELAYRVGTDQNVVALYESGGTTPGIEGIRRFAEALNVPASYLVDRTPPNFVAVCPCCGSQLKIDGGRVYHGLQGVSGAEN